MKVVVVPKSGDEPKTEVGRNHKADEQARNSKRSMIRRRKPPGESPYPKCVKGSDDDSQREPKSQNTLTHNNTKKPHKPEENQINGRRGVAGRRDGTLKQACFQGYPESAVYVQVSIDSRNSAIHNAYHSSLCPSSLFEPRHSSLKVVNKKKPIVRGDDKKKSPNPKGHK